MKVKGVGFDIVVAMDDMRGIGVKGDLPWSLPGDMAYFRSLTLATHLPRAQNALIMGRKTWESLPAKFRPLPGRLNVVLSRQPAYEAKGALVFPSLNEALLDLDKERDEKKVDRLFVIGGAALYQEALLHERCQKAYITEVKGDFSCDCFLAALPSNWKKIHESEWHQDQNISFSFCIYC